MNYQERSVRSQYSCQDQTVKQVKIKVHNPAWRWYSTYSNCHSTISSHMYHMYDYNLQGPIYICLLVTHKAAGAPSPPPEKIMSLCHLTLKTARLYLHSSGQNIGMWRTERQTDMLSLLLCSALQATWMHC